MTTIKVKFRQSTVAGKAGTIYYQVIHKREMVRINTDMHVLPQQWDSLRCEKESCAPQLAVIGNKIKADVAWIEKMVEEWDDSNIAFSAKDIVLEFKKHVEVQNGVGGRPTHYNITAKDRFFPFMKQRIDKLEEEGRYCTAANYQHTLNSFHYFVESQNVGPDICFLQIEPSLVARYETWMKNKGLKRNTTSFYMRILRAVYNRAADEGRALPGNPFAKAYTGIDKTSKRAVKETLIARLNGLNVRNRPALQLAKDMFLFSFSTCGMAFVDMIYLKHTNIKEGYISYARHKTGQPLRVKVVPMANDIIQRYKCADSPFVFPVMKTQGSRRGYNQYRTGLSAYNHSLRIISSMLPSAPTLTSYVSRHSWATIARDHGNDIAAISKALGHCSESTTQIYLASINNCVVDKTNEDVVSCIKH